MNKISIPQHVEKLLQSTGITIGGQQPWDIQIHNNAFYQRVINRGALGLGEAYIEKWWDCQQLDEFFNRILRAELDTKVGQPLQSFFKKVLAKIINFQSKKYAKLVGKKHYDLGNALFKAMLDKRMVYSCGYWKSAQNLEEAQLSKLDLICQKLQLKPGLRLLDIGCGWGGLAKYAAEQYGVHVVGITISQQQYEYAKEYCKGLPIEIRLQDYRDIHDTFDRIVSVGMFEHVGHTNYDIFIQKTHRHLTEEGLFLVHTIGVNLTNSFVNDWIIKYIFPNGMLPSIAQIAKATEKFFVMEDWHSFGAYYDNTLIAWYKNFIRHWEELKLIYDERFYRMWTYYLLSCAGSFRARSIQLWQIVFSKHGIVGGYVAPR
ncbi:MAG TPA: cyclopropane fatty acyl phospholipid synthase [Gammaproteobacteria bacterium]|nr:cyclopropane fatty acyl phospholipid synthase [Gammaproteobacteria bacterium]